MTTRAIDLQSPDVTGTDPERTPVDVASTRELPRLESFTALFHEHVDAVRRTLVHLGVWDRDADDETQRVFETVWRKLDELDPRRGTPRAWILGIACNVARDWRKWTRTQRVRAIHLVEDPTALDMRRSGRDASEERLDHQRSLRLLAKLLAELPEEQRTVVVMCRIEGLTARDVAAVLDISANTVSSRLRLALEKLEAALDRTDGDGS
ncbi:MAG: sigma-70 family RNA polymerase sigma factor [Deltaproteobacteria bacterium]|nr:sigma-70 family RNA polymerase sigma factor [Deltaproteobacteria bacterium]